MPPQRRQLAKAREKASPLARPSRLTRGRRSKTPTPGPSASQQEGLILKIIVAIFWDLNAYTTLEKMLNHEPTKEDVEFHQVFWRNTLNFLHKAAWDHIHQQFEDALSLRCADFVQQFSWKFFAICAHAESFLWACENEVNTVWEGLKETLAREERCLEVFARTHGLKWQLPLLSIPSGLSSELDRARAPEIDLGRYHPSQIVLTEDGRLRLARYQGKTQVHIDKSFYNSSAHGHVQDPSLRVVGQGSCYKCMDRAPCECVPGPDIGDLIQLTEYQNKGIGIRALTNIKAGDALGEFLGEIIPMSDQSYEANVYDITLVKECPGSEQRESLGIISPAWTGNWVRFINHSCESSTDFFSTNAGQHVTIIVRALRDISIFEEITVNYGEEYWASRECLCGSANCLSRKTQQTRESGNPLALSFVRKNEAGMT